jgi:hypothetical protein
VSVVVVVVVVVAMGLWLLLLHCRCVLWTTRREEEEVTTSPWFEYEHKLALLLFFFFSSLDILSIFASDGVWRSESWKAGRGGGRGSVGWGAMAGLNRGGNGGGGPGRSTLPPQELLEDLCRYFIILFPFSLSLFFLFPFLNIPCEFRPKWGKSFSEAVRRNWDFSRPGRILKPHPNNPPPPPPQKKRLSFYILHGHALLSWVSRRTFFRFGEGFMTQLFFDSLTSHLSTCCDHWKVVFVSFSFVSMQRLVDWVSLFMRNSQIRVTEVFLCIGGNWCCFAEETKRGGGAGGAAIHHLAEFIILILNFDML